MSHTAGHRDRARRPSSPSHIVPLLLILLILSAWTLRSADASPVPDLAREYQSLMSEGLPTDNTTDDTTDNSTEIAANTDVYVIKAVVYEIGILTDTDNTTDESTERHERVDISLYDPPYTDEFS